MTIEEAIEHCNEVAAERELHIGEWDKEFSRKCKKCAAEHRQLAEWLEDYKRLLGKNRWIPVKWHYITEEEREKEDYPKDWLTMFDCPMPDDEEEILITIRLSDGHLYVEKDICYIDDDGFYFDGRYDWINDVIAWCPLPEPYKAESEEEG